MAAERGGQGRRAAGGAPAGPLDARVDRRAFLVRIASLGGMAAAGIQPAVGAASAAVPGPDALRAFRRALPAPRAEGIESPTELTAWEAAELIRDGRLGTVELLDACLERISRWEPVYRAFNALAVDEARARALHLDREGGADAGGGLLYGIPLGVKDNLYTAGLPTTANSHIFRDFVPEWSATAVRRLVAAGGIVAGKTQMGPLATTRALTPDGEITTVNAWAPGDPRVSPGGSSSGSATAVAARLLPAAIGTQTGGSITVPALAQGLTGLKPTFGRVSLRGVIPLTYTRDHVGPLARDARDAALLLQAMAGPDPEDPRTLGLPPVPDYLAAATPVGREERTRLRWPTRIGVPPGWTEGTGGDADLRRTFLRDLEAAGAEVVEVPLSPEWRELSSGAFNALRLPERSEAFLPWLRRDVRLFGVTLSPWIQGLLLSGEEYLKGQRARVRLLALTLDEVFSLCDVVALTDYLAFDMTGLPLLALPVGFEETSAGARPKGVLLGAPPFGEERLLSVAATWQERTDHHRRRPPDPRPSDEARLGPPGRNGRGRLGLEEVAELGQ